ncbi:MAG: transcriptional regulator PadR family protein [Gemmatimonadetes bacterium]|nr:transcriptional regulator PadR family protein [Gemmatimonadota bacterium]
MFKMYIGSLGHDHCGPRHAKWGWEGFPGGGDFWGGPRGGPWKHRGRAGRVFEQGDLKYVILRLLEEKPRHGYEIIKELEEKFGGAYSPSPGTVYPTLTMLEDLGYARVTPEEGGKKIFEITDEGRAYLAEHRETVDGIFERIARFVDGFLDAPMTDVNVAFKKVAQATYGTATKRLDDRAHLQKIREILERAAAELGALDDSAK